MHGHSVHSLNMHSAWSGLMLLAAGKPLLDACRSNHALPCFDFAVEPRQAATLRRAPDAGYRIVQQRKRFHQVRLACAPVQDPARQRSRSRDNIRTLVEISSIVRL